jgi:SAM-dependent methyltransferase
VTSPRASFSADWLALREPYDGEARNRDVLAAVTTTFAGQADIAVVDLACGTGASLRALAAHLPRRQSWRLVDNDLSLLARAGANPPAGVTVTPAPVDLARDLEAALDGPLDLVTTSALLDLVSADWLERFAVEVAARRLPVYAALTYDGRAALEPADPFDARIIAAVNRHQRRDKGFGPALGPAAAAEAIARFQQVGYTVMQGASDWMFAPPDREIQADVLSGWAIAARELDELPLGDIAGWLARRRDLVAAGRATMRVGHVDLFARPIGAR